MSPPRMCAPRGRVGPDKRSYSNSRVSCSAFFHLLISVSYFKSYIIIFFIYFYFKISAWCCSPSSFTIYLYYLFHSFVRSLVYSVPRVHLETLVAHESTCRCVLCVLSCARWRWQLSSSCFTPRYTYTISTHIYIYIYSVGGVLLCNHTCYLRNPIGINIYLK